MKRLCSYYVCDECGLESSLREVTPYEQGVVGELRPDLSESGWTTGPGGSHVCPACAAKVAAAERSTPPVEHA